MPKKKDGMSDEEREALRILGIHQKRAKDEATLLRHQSTRDSIYTALFRAEEELTVAFRAAGSDPNAENIARLQRCVENLGRGTQSYLEECARVNVMLRRLGSFEEKAHDTTAWLHLVENARQVYAYCDPRIEKWICPLTRTVLFVVWDKLKWDGTEKPQEEWTFTACGYTISETGDFNSTSWSNGYTRDSLAGYQFQGRS